MGVASRFIHSIRTDQRSDTTGSALTVLFMLLAYYRSYQERVREEVEQSFADNTYSCARPQVLLDAVINETLRLAPPILFNLQRYPSKGGITIGDVYIPEGTVCCIGAFQLHHGILVQFPPPFFFFFFKSCLSLQMRVTSLSLTSSPPNDGRHVLS